MSRENTQKTLEFAYDREKKLEIRKMICKYGP